MKIVLIVATTSGKIVYDYFIKNKNVEVLLTVTFPDGTKKPRHIDFADSPKIVKTTSLKKIEDKIINLNPELIIVEGWSELLSERLIKNATKGAIGFHPSLLPNDKGRSVLAWQIEENYSESGATMFYYNIVPDGGDIIGIDRFSIEPNDYIDDVLNKLDNAVYNLLRAYFPLIRKGIAPRKKQNPNDGNFRRLRTEKDCYINWNSNANCIVNKIRAISKPYPGAIGELENKHYKIYRASVFGGQLNLASEHKTGSVLARLIDNTIIVQAKDGQVKISDYEPII